ncbi:MAG: peptide deformylase [Oceanobacter sp.]
MALLDILEFPDPRLRTLAKPVTEVDDRVRKIIDDMFDTMYEAPGIGLAATQVNIHERIITMDLSEDKNEPLVFINPEIEVLDGEMESMQEGCLSVPGFYEDISRIEHCMVRALDRNGDAFELECHGLLAVCIQHEIDHLDGKLMVDYVSPLKRKRIKDKLDKKHKQEARARGER